MHGNALSLTDLFKHFESRLLAPSSKVKSVTLGCGGHFGIDLTSTMF